MAVSNDAARDMARVLGFSGTILGRANAQGGNGQPNNAAKSAEV